MCLSTFGTSYRRNFRQVGPPLLNHFRRITQHAPKNTNFKNPHRMPDLYPLKTMATLRQQIFCMHTTNRCWLTPFYLTQPPSQLFGPKMANSESYYPLTIWIVRVLIGTATKSERPKSWHFWERRFQKVKSLIFNSTFLIKYK